MNKQKLTVPSQITLTNCTQSDHSNLNRANRRDTPQRINYWIAGFLQEKAENKAG